MSLTEGKCDQLIKARARSSDVSKLEHLAELSGVTSSEMVRTMIRRDYNRAIARAKQDASPEAAPEAVVNE